MANHITLVAGLVGEIKYATYQKDNGDGFRANFTVAQNQSVWNKETNSYDELSPKFWNITVFDSVARSLEKSNLPKGTPLLIQGELVLRESQEYTDRQGVVHPKEIVNQINVVNIGALIGKGRSTNVVLTKNVSRTGTNTTQEQSTYQTTTQQTSVQQSQTTQSQPTTNNNSFNFASSADFDEDDIFG